MLGLTSVAENIVMDNLEIFKMNGFQFHFDSDGQILPIQYAHVHVQYSTYVYIPII